MDKNYYKKLFYFDIETVGRYKDLDVYKDNDERGYNLFLNKCRRRTINTGWSGDCNKAYLEKCALLPEYGTIVCVTYGVYVNGDLRIISYTGDEKDIIDKCSIVFNWVGRKKLILCGYNIKGFDIPWINRKFLKYDITIPIVLSRFNKKPWEMDVIDISEVWKGGNFEHISFDEVAYELGIESPKKLLSGEKVHEYFWDTGDIETIKNYCEDDVKACIHIAEKIIHNF